MLKVQKKPLSTAVLNDMGHVKQITFTLIMPLWLLKSKRWR